MTDLIKIIEKEDGIAVSMRELYDYLEINTDFSTWCKRMFEYGFTENVDYSSNLGKSNGGRPSIDYALSIDAAKEISMIQRSDKGKQARLYFIEIEKKFLSQLSGIPTSFGEALILAGQVQLKLEAAEKENKIVNLALEKANSKINLLSHSNHYYTSSEIAKELELRSAIALNKELEARKIQYKVNGVWVLYSKYSEKGYTEIKQQVLENNKTIYTHHWTDLGRQFILNLGINENDNFKNLQEPKTASSNDGSYIWLNN